MLKVTSLLYLAVLGYFQTSLPYLENSLFLKQFSQAITFKYFAVIIVLFLTKQDENVEQKKMFFPLWSNLNLVV